MNILIITGGRTDEDFALGFLHENSFDHIIVVDGALKFWDEVVSTSDDPPEFDHLVGDFDTIDHKILGKYLDRDDITVHRFIPEKDYTDTDIAARLAIELSAGERPSKIFMLGALGTRMDHTLANVQLLSYIRSAGLEGIIVDRYNRIRLISGAVELKKEELFGDFLSLVPLTPRLEGVSMKGFKYEVSDLELVLGETRCVSNEVCADTCHIDIGGGLAWLIESRD